MERRYIPIWEYNNTDHDFDRFLHDLSKRMENNEHTADEWYEWLIHDPWYDYRAMYNDYFYRDIVNDDNIVFPIKYVRDPDLLDLQSYYPVIYNGLIYDLTDRFGRVEDDLSEKELARINLALEYLNKLRPGGIAYLESELYDKLKNVLINSSDIRAGIIKECIKAAIDSGLSFKQACALVGNAFLESSFIEKNLSNLYLMDKNFKKEYDNWRKQLRLEDSPLTLTRFMALLLNHTLEGNDNAYNFMGTSFDMVSPSIVEMHDNDIAKYNKWTKDNKQSFTSAFDNPMTARKRTKDILGQFNYGSLNDMTSAVAMLLERLKLDDSHYYGQYVGRMNYANALYDCLKDEFEPLQLDYLFDWRTPLKKRGGRLLPKRNVLPLI